MSSLKIFVVKFGGLGGNSGDLQWRSKCVSRSSMIGDAIDHDSVKGPQRQPPPFRKYIETINMEKQSG
ncbi:hypothetical protein TNCV_1899051 [Trichonephila clavipes]|nr:hypothetical protein TNCV_1899051 [Trichonephila clavipes]